jgi:hypothetical protein
VEGSEFKTQYCLEKKMLKEVLQAEIKDANE